MGNVFLNTMARFVVLVLLLVSVLSVYSAGAQSPEEMQQIQQAQQAAAEQKVDVSRYIQSESRFKRSSSGGTESIRSGSSTGAGGLRPFGANLFDGSFEAERSDGLNPTYRVAPGDKISVQLWGTVELAEVLTVDNQGNIFIPQIGPVPVIDVPATEVNRVVKAKIRSVYTNNVNAYVNLLTATPVSVFVAGPVIRPGQYAGLPTDSILYFLKRAGGVDPIRGSYRRITVLRNNNAVQEYDLYKFMREGRLPSFSFKDGDVILVGEQGPMVTVEGAARYPFRFELTEQRSKGSDLTYFSRPLAKTSHVAITGNRPDGPVSVYVPIAEFENFDIYDGDVVLFNDDLQPQVISVKISGSYIGPSFYTVKKDARLLDLLPYIEVDAEHADIDSIYIKRESVKERQRELLDESLRRLERSVFTAPASSDGEARIRAQEAELVMRFVERARQVEPLGKVVLSEQGKIANIRLEQGDEIVIPLKTDLVQVSGEVLMPQAVVYNPKARLTDYVAWAGGYSERADDERIAVIHANGLTTFFETDESSHWFSSTTQVKIQPGDQIMVLPRVDTKLIQSIKDITQIIYQVALAANVALDSN
ncbi:polysaccharide biosynthesis/export family protein [Lacimicrobium alkaliphilum]|uniref:Capreomycidine hydroxylase n=1 Tax=Lacimicrobium alkaliphilum TaxID=1526571 RepID=A0ABQ1R689_9ALTE|nr:polysaccharide biosynthesis/export family protein [Lacimicrobium alkaliphilum]GGD57744.1 capreomycidine hydroxylase [Lacimicrobium alkaliphilum]